MKKNLILGLIAFLGLYLFSTGTSFAVFTYVFPSSLGFLSPQGNNTAQQDATKSKESKFKLLLDNSGPKTEVCPINGAKYTAEERKAWEKRRPLLVMIENHEEARPQSGLSNADAIYETVAEGGITRFMGVFYCGAQAYDVTVGPVRSARTFFLDWASEYGQNPLYAHVGGANCDKPTGSGCSNGARADALGQIEKYGWGGSTGNDLNQFSIGYPTFWRDYERLGHTVATEHTMYSTTEKLWAVGKNRGWTEVDSDNVKWDKTFLPWKFTEDKSVKDGTTNQIKYDFWSNSPAGDYSVSWAYDATRKAYLRSNSGKPHMDLNTNEQLSTNNLIVMYSVESFADDDYPGNVHLLYGTIGKGDAVLFQKGNTQKITWGKTSRTARTKFLDENGKEIKFIEGKIWISNLPKGNKSLEY